MTDTILAFNRELAKEYGVSAALLYQELQRSQYYWERAGKLNDDGMFWKDQKDIAEWILLSTKTISRAIKDLEDAGLIKKKVGYRPGTTTPTTWWRVISKTDKMSISKNGHDVHFYIKANTKSNTVKENDKGDNQEDNSSLDSSSEDGGEVRMRPEVLYQKVRQVWPGSNNEMRKQKVAGLEKLQEDLSDESIIEGIRLIAKNPTYTFDGGKEFTETLTHLLVTGDIERTAQKITMRLEEKQLKEKKKESNVSFDLHQCY